MRAAAPALPLPDWPALMDEALAAAYCTMSVESFRALAAAHRCAPVDFSSGPKDRGLRLLRWARTDLDRLVERLNRRGGEPAPDGRADGRAQDAAAAALAK